MKKTEFTNDLLTWYYNHQRVLPWRDNPTPYRVWVSEIMLQQTRVAAVIPYFNRFVEELPTIESLSKVDDDRLMKLWEGLGYYNRVRNMKVAANQIMNEHSGEFPTTKDKVKSLKGIGPYTSGAILSIAFNQKHSAVDGNVHRVFSRLLEIKEDIKQPHIKQLIKQKVDKLLPESNVGDFNQALMEIGATVCVPNGTPLCEICPLQKHCKAYKNETTKIIPIKRKKKAVPVENKTVLLFQYLDKFAIEKRKDSGLLAGMYQFPMIDHFIKEEEIYSQYKHVSEIKKITPSQHKFTHKEWNMKGYHIILNQELDYNFVTVNEINDVYSIPSAFKDYKLYLGDLNKGEENERRKIIKIKKV